MTLLLRSSLWGKACEFPVSETLSHIIGLAYGDGYPEWGELRVVTSNDLFKEKLSAIFNNIAHEYRWSASMYTRTGNISERPQHIVALNSTMLRRALFSDSFELDYDALYSVAMDEALSPHFQAGLSDAEGSLLEPLPIEYPHGRVFAATNNDRRLLGIARLSLVNKLRLEPSSVRIRLSSYRGREHTIRGNRIVARKNNYVLEVLSGAKFKWLSKIGPLLWHPVKAVRAKELLSTYT